MDNENDGTCSTSNDDFDVIPFEDEGKNVEGKMDHEGDFNYNI